MSIISKNINIWSMAALCMACQPAPATTVLPADEATTKPPMDATDSTDSTDSTASAGLHPQLHGYLATLEPEIEALAAERRAALDQIAAYAHERRSAGEPARLLFICTHNSRRSHMGQLWAATAAAYFGVAGIETFSGGTEATAFNPRAVAAMRRAGFEIDPAEPSDENPHYEVRIGPDAAPMLAFSKTWEDPSNPSEGFAAIMTCTQADAACPFVRGASLRIALPYDDPKAADDTPAEAERYDERARQIAIEMLYLARAIATLEQPG